MTTIDVFNQNPYESNAALTTHEAQVLWEYAKLAQNIKDLTARTKDLSGQPDQRLLARLRLLERKMGLVLTLFKASVWAVVNEQPPAEYSDQYADTTVS